MTLIGRSDDLITHVLVNDPWERVADFLYPGCPGSFHYPGTTDPISSHDAQLCLAVIPFIPLRYLFQRDIHQTPGSYLKLIHRLRSRAIE